MKKPVTREIAIRTTGVIHGLHGSFREVSVATLTAAATEAATDARACKVHAKHKCHLRTTPAGQEAQRERAENRLAAAAALAGLSEQLSTQLDTIYPLTVKEG